MALLQKGIEIAAGRLPKVITPKTHAAIDYAVVGSFFLMGALFWRRNRRAAIGAAFCGAAFAANNLLTDYPGGASPLLSYKSHGRIDATLAGVTAALPRVLKISDHPQATFFDAQALAETCITALTDFDYYE